LGRIACAARQLRDTVTELLHSAAPEKHAAQAGVIFLAARELIAHIRSAWGRYRRGRTSDFGGRCFIRRIKRTPTSCCLYAPSRVAGRSSSASPRWGSRTIASREI